MDCQLLMFGDYHLPRLDPPPKPTSRSACPYGGGNDFPAQGRGRKLPPTTKMVPGPRPLASVCRPGAPAWGSLRTFILAAESPRAHGSPSWAPQSLLPHPGGHPAVKELPRWRGELSPRRTVQGLHDREGAGLPIPVTRSKGSNKHRNDHCIRRPSFSEWLYK